MKNFLIIFLSVLVGISLIFSYSKLFPSKKVQPQKISAITSHFSLNKAPANSLRAEIASFSGAVQWQSRVASEPAKLTTLRQLQQGENILTGDAGTMTMKFPNTGTITLLPNTKLEIIQTLPVNIVLSQDTGNATYQKIGTIPLSVHSLDLLMEQKSGTMKIAADDVGKNVSVSVTSGSVTAAFEDTDNNTQIQSITTGETFYFDDLAKEGSIQ